MALSLSRSCVATRPVRAARYTSPVCRPVRVLRGREQTARSVLVRAEAEDFDAYLIKMAEKFEKADNKPLVVAYVAAAIFAFFTAEWLIHLPALDIILGFPVQLVGLLTLPYLIVRWTMDGQSAGKDIEGAVGNIVSKLPGLEKKA